MSFRGNMGSRAIAMAMTVLFALTSVAFGADCPQGDTVGVLKGNGQLEPLRIAVDNRGNTYVADNANDNVTVFGYAGSVIGRRSIDYPLGIAVDDSGRIYVGRADFENNTYIGEVTVYDPSFNALFSLGSGLGEFRYPVGIATDANRVYVADSRANQVRVYDRVDGAFLFAFGGYSVPPVAGDLVMPDGIAVHPVTGDLYITDRALYYDTTNPSYYDWQKWALGAGVHIFTRDGAHVDTFGTYGFSGTPGEISLIGGITMDGAGRVYVSDYNMGFLHVFDDAGTALCAFDYDNPEGSFPQGLAMGADRRLMVATYGSVRVIGTDNYYSLSTDPSELVFSAQSCGSQPASQDLTLINSGGGTVEWSIASSASWLGASVTSGTIEGQGAVSVAIQVDKDGLSLGTHSAELTVSAAGAELAVPVTLEVLPPSVLNVSPASFEFNVEGSGTNPYDTLNIELVGGGTWSASSDSAWLGITPDGGPADTLIMASVGVDTTGLSSGTYTGNIIISAGCTSNSPVTVPVTLNYVSGGTIEVTTNLDDAAFTLTGPASYSGGGKSFTVQNVPEGTYTIEFEDVAGFLSPASYSLEVVNGETTRFKGDYIDLRERLSILAGQGSAPSSLANELRVCEGDGTLKSSILLEDQGSGKSFWRNSIPASGDIDGDGVEEIIVSHDWGVITGLEADGTPVPGLEFMPFAGRTYADVALADLDGDGVDEIIAGSMHWSANGAAVRVFGYSDGQVIDTGVHFLAYTAADFYRLPGKSLKSPGTKVAAGDVDGDGIAEIITVQDGGLTMHTIQVRIFKVDVSGGPGNWSVTDAGGVRVDDMVSYYSDVTAGDVDADGVDELIVSGAPDNTDAVQPVRVMAFEADGTVLLDMTVDSVGGVDVAAGDLDFDGAAEIVVGEGAFREGDSSLIRVFEADGALVTSFLPFDFKVGGVRIAVGDL